MRRDNNANKAHSSEWKKSLKKAHSAAKREVKQRQKKLKGLLRRECKPPECLHCDSLGELTIGANAVPELELKADQWFYVCPTCEDSRVGCHENSKTPMGKMANKETRIARIAAHRVFDGLRERLGLTRFAAYRMLGKEMGLTRSECHIAQFTVEQCAKVVQICGGGDTRRT